MSKIVNVEKEIKRFLGDNCACYVLITCSEPSPDGNMDVEMKYEGDETLAAFLVENAGQVFDDRKNRRESK
ncbi:MAG TPA: hypothetical protein VLF94_03480 [Chlamydiales bacterium]|nr:hypothetical protein [Chlamydiales bacterium]